jgi:hypothetical protein
MFYARINKIKVFDNREGFLGLFNRRAEMRIYSYLSPSPSPQGRGVASLQEKEEVLNNQWQSFTLSDLANLPDDAARKLKLVEAVQADATKFAQSNSIEINGVKDKPNQWVCYIRVRN